MPRSETCRVFISYARKDGADLALRLQSDLAKEGCDVWLDTQRISSGSIWSIEIEREIDMCHVALALLSPGSYASEICRAEQIRSLDKGNRVIPVLAVKGAERPLYLYARQYRDFTNEANYVNSFRDLLSDIRGDVTATLPDIYQKPRITYLTAPPRVTNYLERPEALWGLRNALFAEDHRQPIALTALAGMGGIGKTVLAKALTEDEVVQRAFPDGIVWLTAGKERKRDFIEEMCEVAKALGEDLSGYDTALACENQYRTTIANKAALVVVDDVWSKADIEPLLADSPRSRFLFTTRDASIGRFVGAHEHRADLLDAVRSRELLALWANVAVAELPTTADEVIAECGRLPLAISIVGAMLRDAESESWSDTLDLLRKADLSAIQEQLPEGQQSFFRAVEVSFQSLRPEMQERYKAMAVLLEDMAAPPAILQTLWSANEAETRRTSRHFVDRSLAQRDGAAESIRLHDLQLDYVRAQYSDPESLKLVHAALVRSLHLIRRDPKLFTAQMAGRLLTFKQQPAIGQLLDILEVNSPRPCVWPLWPSLEQPGSPTLRILDTEGAFVHAVALSADGRRAVSAANDGNMHVWNLESNLPPRVLEGHTAPVLSVALSADGKRAISGSEDGSIRVWYLESNAPPRVLIGHTANVNAVSMSADGKWAISGSDDQTLRVWDLDGKTPPRVLEEQTNRVTSVALSANGKRAVSSAWDRALRVWELNGNDPPRVLEGHTGKVVAVAISEDGKHAVSGSWDRTVRVWNLEDNSPSRVLEGHTRRIAKVAISANGLIAASASSEDRSLRVWDLRNNLPMRIVADQEQLLEAVAFNADGTRGISASGDMLRVWNFENIFASLPTKGHTKSVTAVAITNDCKNVVSCSSDDPLLVWDLEGNVTPRVVQDRTATPGAIRVLSADGKRGISGRVDGTLWAWDLEGISKPRVLERDIATDDLSMVALSADGKRAISGFPDGSIRIWELDADTPPRILQGHAGVVRAVALSADGRRAVSGSDDETVRVWDLEGATPPLVFQGHTSGIDKVAISVDGHRVVSGGGWGFKDDKTLRIWDIDGNEPPVVLEDRLHWVRAIAFSDDGKRAVSAFGHTLLVWEIGSGESITAFVSDVVLACCAWRGNCIAAGDTHGQVYLFHWLD